MLDVGVIGEAAGCSLLGLPVESDGMMLKSLWRLVLLLWALVREIMGQHDVIQWVPCFG